MPFQSPPLFVASNHHSAGCGTPPAIDGDAPGAYHGYFENRYGEQFVFAFDRSSATARLWCGDAGWEHSYSVVDGRVEGLILAPEESAWLHACWSAATAGS